MKSVTEEKKPTRCDDCKHMSVYQLSTGAFCGLCGSEGREQGRRKNEHGTYNR